MLTLCSRCEGGAGEEKMGGVDRGWMSRDELMRRLGVLLDIEDVEDGTEGVRTAGVGRLCMDCDDIFAL